MTLSPSLHANGRQLGCSEQVISHRLLCPVKPDWIQGYTSIYSLGSRGLQVSNLIFSSKYGADFMESSSSQVSKSGSISHPTLTVSNTKSTTNTLNIGLDLFAPQGRGIE